MGIVRGGRLVSLPFPLEQVDAHLGVEAGVDDGVGGAVEGRKALDEGAKGHALLGLLDEAVDVQQIEDEERTPADDKHCNHIVYSCEQTREQETDFIFYI